MQLQKYTYAILLHLRHYFATPPPEGRSGGGVKNGAGVHLRHFFYTYAIFVFFRKNTM